MTPSYRKKLIEVALPLKAINEASAREKSIRHGHPSTLHLWWSRKPLATCRAVLFASLVDDPDSDPVYRRADGTVDEDRAGLKRAQLFNLIEELVQWENSNNPRIINAARAEIARCIASRKIELGELAKDTIIVGPMKGQKHPNGAVFGEGVTAWDVLTMKARPEVVNAFLAEHAPPVLDPFCGGGSIPLEAQRLGLRAYASDLNPVPVLITKALIEIPPKFAGRPPVHPPDANEQSRSKGAWSGAEGLAEDVRYYGKWMRDEAEKRIGHLYPKVKITREMAKDRPDLKEYVGQELTVIAWLWARTVPSPNPAVGGAHVPLVRSFWLSTKKGKEAWVRPIIDRTDYRFDVGVGIPPRDFDPKQGTVERTGARCLLSKQPMAFEHIRAEGKAGRMGTRLMAIVAEGARGRVYLSPSYEHEKVARVGLPDNYPDTPVPEQALGFRVQLYGMDKHYKLFTPRQLIALTTFSDLVQEARAKVLADARAAFVMQAASLHPSIRSTEEQAASLHPTIRPTEEQAGGPHHNDWKFQDPRRLPFVEPSSRGELPHLHKEGGSYFVTFRLRDAVRTTPQPRANPAATPKRPEEVADECEPVLTAGSCILGQPEIAAIVRECLHHGAGQRYVLHAWCIMPNHVHVVVTPMAGQTLSAICHTWKSYTAKRINAALGRAGEVWERESFDHLVRSLEHLEWYVKYTEENPVKGGLCEHAEQWPWSSASSLERGRPAACTTIPDDLPLADGGAGPKAYADAVATYLAFTVNRQANRLCTICFWDRTSEKVQQAFSRQALPMTWDYCEASPFSESSGN